MALVDPGGDPRRPRRASRRSSGRELEPLWRAAYASTSANRYEYSPAAKGARRLKTVALDYLMAAGAEDAPALARRQYDEADNMTDRQGALGALANSRLARAPRRARRLLRALPRRSAGARQMVHGAGALDPRRHAGGGRGAGRGIRTSRSSNPNRMRSLVGAFAANQRAFHDASGRGYRFLADMILAVDRLNPQTAARLVPPLGRWRRFDAGPAGSDEGRAGADRRHARASARTCSSRRARAWADRSALRRLAESRDLTIAG